MKNNWNQLVSSEDRQPVTAKASVLLNVLLVWLLMKGVPAWAALPPPFLGELHVTPSAIPTGTLTKVTATFRIPASILAEQGQPETITLNRLDADAQKSVAILASFHDDGSEGDEVPNDGLYTAQASLKIKQPGNVKVTAIATYPGTDTEDLSTMEFTVDVLPTPAVDHRGPWVVVDGDKVIYRDQDGATVYEERASEETARVSNKKRLASDPARPLFTQEHASTSRDQTHVAIIGSLHSRTVSGSKGAEPQVPRGWEFRYQDLAGVLWTKVLDTPDRHFFTSGNSILLSEDGARVVLLAVGESDEKPHLWVYDQFGALLLDEKPALYSLFAANISNNGRYLLLKGLPPVPTADMVQLIVIDIEEPSKRWSELYHGAQVSTEVVTENKAGGFDIVQNGTTRYSFPRQGDQP